MGLMKHYGFRALAWVLRPCFFWIVSKTTSEPTRDLLGIKPDQPILFILPKRSLVDLLVLNYHCHRLGLPLPTGRVDEISEDGEGSLLYLNKPGFLKTRSEKIPALPLIRLIRKIEQTTASDVQVLPVSVFWGKNPGREDLSFFKLLFNDDENAGSLQKFFIVLAHGRNNIVHFGKAFSLRGLVNEKLPTDQTARKTRRILRVHFRRQRNTTLGQKLYVKDVIFTRVLAAKSVQDVINSKVVKKQFSRKRLEAKARKYVREIAADQSYSVVRVLEILLRYVWTKMFSGVRIIGFDKIRDFATKEYELIYLPSHRSHLDYLLVNYSVYQGGLPTPHTAAGINLNFWPVGGLLRRAGAFFLRRSFGGDRLYTAVFNEYLNYLIQSGYPVAFFPEGGRSRTGRLLHMRTGMLSMVLRSANRAKEGRRIAFVPVYVGYDKVVEVKSYLKELSGRSKRKESFSSLIQLPKLLRQDWGRAHINFGEPIDLQDILKAAGSCNDYEDERTYITKATKDLAGRVAIAINSSVVITRTSLVSLALLSLPQKALPEEELLGLIRVLLKIIAINLPGIHFELPEGDPSDFVLEAEKLGSIRRLHHPAGDVLYMNEMDGILNSYYRNNILHAFVIPSLISSFFNRQSQIGNKILKEGVFELLPFLCDEFHLPWSKEQYSEVYELVLDRMIQCGLISAEGDHYRRPVISSLNFGFLSQIGKILGLVFERYAIISALLYKHLEKGVIDSGDFHISCQKMAQRLAILSGIPNPEAADLSLFKNHIVLLKRMGYLLEVNGGKSLKIDPRIASIIQKTKLLLSLEMRGSVERISVR